MHVHECENCHKQFDHDEVLVNKYGTPCTEIRNGFCSVKCEEEYPKREAVKPGGTYHAPGCDCGFCKMGFTEI